MIKTAFYSTSIALMKLAKFLLKSGKCNFKRKSVSWRRKYNVKI